MTEVAGTESVQTPDGPAAPDAPEELALAAEFPEASREQWRELVAGVLRKSGAIDEGFDGLPESKLVTRTYDGLEIQPLYTADDTIEGIGFPGLPPFVRSARPEGSVATGWDIRARFARRDAKATNTAVLADLEGGVSSIWLRVGSAGVPVAELADALNEVYIDLAPVTLDAAEDYEAAAAALLELFAEREIPASAAVATLGADPIGLTARTGSAHPLAPAAELAARIATSHPKVRTIVADGLPFHEAGGSDAQELGATIAAGVAYLRALTEAGLDVDAAAGQLEFRLAATADQFLTIAKFRAARRLWARVTEVSGGKNGQGAGMRQHAVTSPAMLTQRDPWVNMLRTTLACFGAGVGGADAITVLPFDSAIGQPDAFSARIARNTHAVLLEESKLAGVIDPAGGSWYVENLTDDLAKAAWREFTAIEAAGGIEAELASGALAGRLAETWEKRSKRLATRRDPITGVSEFPNLTEKTVVRDPLDPVAEGGLPRHRYAEAFEALRDRSDARPTRPRVFLATLGPVAAHNARASFAANLFQAGGIEAVNPGAPEDVVAEFRASDTKVACLCGSNTSYAEEADSVAKALKEAGATSVLLAGKPGDHPDVTGYLYAGCDALEVLTGTLTELGVQ